MAEVNNALGIAVHRLFGHTDLQQRYVRIPYGFEMQFRSIRYGIDANGQPTREESEWQTSGVLLLDAPSVTIEV